MLRWESFDPAEIGVRNHKEIVHTYWKSFQSAISRIRCYVTYSDVAPEQGWELFAQTHVLIVEAIQINYGIIHLYYIIILFIVCFQIPMNQSFEFLLSQQQVEFMQTKLPSGYSFLLSTLSQPRESRITKKVARYDASFQSSKQDSFQIEDTGKRPQRSVAPIKEFKEPANENVKKGLSLLQKIRAHPYFNDIYSAVSSFANIENIEASFAQGGSLQNLWSDIRKLFQASYQQHSKDSPEYLHTTQLENHFNELFKNVHQPPKKKPIQQQPKPDQAMTYSEKRQLGNNIRELPVEHLKGVWEIVSQTVKAEGEEEIEFDIDKLPPKVARQLERYVVTKLQSNKKKIKTDAVAQSSEHKNNNQESSFPSESSE